MKKPETNASNLRYHIITQSENYTIGSLYTVEPRSQAYHLQHKLVNDITLLIRPPEAPHSNTTAFN